MKIRQSRVDCAAARERCAEAKPWPEVVAVAETTFLTSARFAGNIRAVLAHSGERMTWRLSSSSSCKLDMSDTNFRVAMERSATGHPVV